MILLPSIIAGIPPFTMNLVHDFQVMLSFDFMRQPSSPEPRWPSWRG